MAKKLDAEIQKAELEKQMGKELSLREFLRIKANEMARLPKKSKAKAREAERMEIEQEMKKK